MVSENLFVEGKDTFVTLPTGYGKSIIYGILPIVFDKMRGKFVAYIPPLKVLPCTIGCEGSIVVCISPLASIMIDQQEKFISKGITAEYVGKVQEDPQVVGRVLKGQLQLLFISPESLLNNSKYRSMLLIPRYYEHLVAVVIDEAHCVKTW